MTRAALGAHVSTAGGVTNAFARGQALACESLQIFVKSPNQWRAKSLGDDEATSFRAARAAGGALPVVAHAAYLINLAAAEPILGQSRAGYADELGRGAALGLDGVVVHPGAHLGRGVDEALTAIAASLDVIAAALPENAPKMLLELTAGQGTVVGHTLEQLATIRARTRHAERVAYCLDTCHAFAAGYELGTAVAVEEFLAEVDQKLGFGLVACIHLNDSAHDKGSRKDRHANLGTGKIGLEGLRRLVTEPLLAGVPAILETPLGDDELGHARDLATLRRLLEDGPPKAFRKPAPKPPTPRRKSPTKPSAKRR
jgi:deoxyribonuclease-4